MGNWLQEREFLGREGAGLWSSVVLASKSSRASCSVLLWCLRAEFGLAWVSALDGLFIFSGAGRCAMRFLSHSICLQKSDSEEFWIPLLLHRCLKCFVLILRLKQSSRADAANTTHFYRLAPQKPTFYNNILSHVFYSCLFKFGFCFFVCLFYSPFLNC